MLGFAVLVVAAFALSVLFKKLRTSTPSLNTSNGGGSSEPPKEAPIKSAGGTFPLDIVGESHYQDSLNSICGGKNEDGHEKIVTARVIPEFDNQYDSNAYKIEIDNKIVGYLPKNIAAEFKLLIGDRAVTCPAIIRGGWKRNRSEGHYGVKLDIAW